MVKRAMFADCAKCDVQGPPGDVIASALEAAEADGWLIGDRPHDHDDYCPECRAGFERPLCAVTHKGKQSLALYTLQTGKRVTHACGIHAQQVQRELFASGAESVTVTKTGARRRGQTA